MIDLLGPGHHRYVIGRVDGFSSVMHQAAIVDGEGERRHVFVKAFPVGSKGLANEVCGWLLARAAGIPTAERAWVMLLDLDLLRSIHPKVEWPDKESGLHAVWVTEAVTTHAADCIVSLIDGDVWAHRLNAWEKLHHTVALMDHLHNIDANGGNLVATAVTEFAVIDFAEILGGQDWTPKSLIKLGYFHNKLSHLAWGSLPSELDVEEIRTASDTIRSAWPAIRSQVEQWWQDLIIDPRHCQSGLAWLDKQAKGNI